MHTNFSVIEKPFGLSSPADLFLSPSKKEILLYSYAEEKLVRFTDNNAAEISHVVNAGQIGRLLEIPNGLYGIGPKKIFLLRKRNSSWYPESPFTDTSVKNFGIATIDRLGNIIIAGHNHLTAIRGEKVFRTPVNHLADQIASDKQGDIWLANRAEELVRYSIHPENPSAYLKQEILYKKEITGIAPRSIVLDSNNNIWIGTRY